MAPKSPKNYFTVVPWMDSEQFNKVYKYLYSDSLSMKRWAVDQISVWDTRCFPSLPTAVESTVGLTRARIHDMLCQADKTFCQEGDIQMLYCMALIRFVNLTLEHHQNAANKIRMSYLAAKHNIPAWLIDLRNDAVHAYCPSLPALRIGADCALQYLKETFWAKEATNIKPKINYPSEQDTSMEDVISEYKSLQFQRVKKETLTRIPSKRLKLVLKKISSFIFQDRERFIDVLVKPGNFFAASDFTRLSKETGWFKAEEKNLVLPPKLEKFWFPLLRKIHQNELMQMFLEKLLLAQEKCCNRSCQKMAVALVQQILLGAKQRGLFGQYFRKKGLLLNTPSLMYACIKSATPYSVELLTALTEKFQNQRKYDPLFESLAIYQGYCIPEEDDRKFDFVFSIEDVEEDWKKKSEKDMNIWSSASVMMDFSDIPLGGVTNPPKVNNKEDEQDDSWKDLIKLGPSIDDNFIIVNKNDGEGTIEEEITHDINTFSVTTRPENFDMVYRRRPNQ